MPDYGPPVITTISIAAASQDGYGWRSDNNWNNVLDGSAAYTDSPNETVLTANKAFYSPTYYAQNPLLRFDISAIPVGALITDAKLKLYMTSKSITNTGYKMVADYYDFGGEPSIAADWVITATPSVFTALDPAAVTTGQVNIITLTDLTGIVPGAASVGFRFSMDAGGASPPTGENKIQFASYDNLSFQEPQLEISYAPLMEHRYDFKKPQFPKFLLRS